MASVKRNYGKESVKTAGNIYCGPAALSVITGYDTDEIAKEILRVRGKGYLPANSVTGAYMSELKAVLERLDCEAQNQFIIKGSLYWLLSTQLNGPAWYIVSVPGHFVTIQVISNTEKYLCDNHTKHQINAGMSARLGQQVFEVLKLTRLRKKQPTFNLWAVEGLGL